MSLLQTVVQVLPIAQRLAVRTLLAQRKKLGSIRTARQELEEADRLLMEIKSRVGGQIFAPRFALPEEVISSADHNTNMEGIFVDISAIYMQVESIGGASSTKTAALNSDYLKSRAATEKLLNDARVFALRKKYKEFNEISIIDFNSARNVTSAVPKALIDEKTRLLELNPISSTRAHVANRLERVTRIYTKTIGPGTKGELSNNLPPEGMIDQKPETFWGTLVLTDMPVRQKYKLSGSVEVQLNGPVVEVYLRFSHIEQLNVVRLLPFGEFPIQVVDISYRPNSTSEVFYPVGDFKPETTLDWIEVNFPKLYASELKISILQENPKHVVYHLPRSLVVNTDIFSHIIKERAQKIVGSLFFDSDLSQQLLKSQDAYSDAIGSLEDIIAKSDLSKSDLEEIDLNLDLMASLGLVFGEIDSEQAQQLIDVDLVSVSEAEAIVEVRKYEYVLGVREIEASYELYAPTCHFESEVYIPQATLSTVQIEVDQERLKARNSWGTYYENSTEWSVDVGEGRILPIHPVNFTGVFSTPSVEDERLEFDRSTAVAFTHLGGGMNSILALRRNGQIISVSGYTATRQTGAIPKMKIQLKEDFWDEDSIYTVDYEVSPDSFELDLLTLLDPRDLSTPESHEKMGPDNDIILKKFPFLLYEVVNRTGNFTKDADQSRWTYNPPEASISTGQLKIYPSVVNSFNEVVSTGHTTGLFVQGVWGDQSGYGPVNVNNLNATYFNNPEGFGYYTKFQDTRMPFHLSGTQATGSWPYEILFFDPPSFTQAQILEMPTEALSGFNTGTFVGYLTTEYSIGVGLDIDRQIFVFDNSIYEPLTVTIGGQPAKNITDYVELQHPAFSIANTADREYEFIHAGRRLYFNQQVNDIEIRVSYQWLTEHIKILGTLRCNKPINPDVTPKVNEIRVLMNTSIL
tara:strand:- start:90 stop:2840 length:2751 start_codon:yes stop_codon:yes gene_type:complete